ncbi:hypothetical protein H696_00744 [Fonticula alba]|uniref:Tyrosine-protein kinase ephrin type A/B receptor-like domain-containing protein n=1 Tax=Fonticula alba TaxID=691883 RepID=A0A058ZGV9_FONAL|nr:hypothetical protein H696_00744 [Fonticula alba]KCV73201.1 hypothetical protein H696_00744 [Fonticula alba]|eukprot:XP_009492902.1 hypothetical protein H696_00744 [Fonticula alba]
MSERTRPAHPGARSVLMLLLVGVIFSITPARGSAPRWDLAIDDDALCIPCPAGFYWNSRHCSSRCQEPPPSRPRSSSSSPTDSMPSSSGSLPPVDPSGPDSDIFSDSSANSTSSDASFSDSTPGSTPGSSSSGSDWIPYPDGYCPSLQMCLKCPPGHFSSKPCINCEPGMYQPNYGHVGCLLCPQGSFAELSGSANCTPCGTGYYLDQFGSSQADDCRICPAGFYCPSVTTGRPIICPEDSVCPEGSSAPRNCSPLSEPVTGEDGLVECKPIVFFYALVSLACVAAITIVAVLVAVVTRKKADPAIVSQMIHQEKDRLLADDPHIRGVGDTPMYSGL